MSAEFQVGSGVSVVQIDDAYAPYWAVTDWYLDGGIGNDSNNGTSVATPLRTGEELLRRLGPYARWDHSVTIHVGVNGLGDAIIVRGAMLEPLTHLDIIGTPTVLASDVLTAYLPLNHETPRATEITGTDITDFAPYVNKRLKSEFGSVVWVAKSNPGGVGDNVARINRGIAIDETSTLSVLRWQFPTPGMYYEVHDIPYVPMLSVTLDGPISKDEDLPQWEQRQFYVESLDCPEMVVRAGNGGRYRNIIFGCRIRDIVITAVALETQRDIVVGCMVHPNATDTTSSPQWVPQYSLFGESAGGNAVELRTGTLISDCLLQGWSVTGNQPFQLQRVQIFDSANPAACTVNDSARLTDVSGANNAVGLAIANGSDVHLDGTVNLRGVVTDCRLTDAPPVDLTQPRCFQPDDYAQKGVATLVAGQVTVTVAWYEHTVQRVECTHGTFGGTPGILSVQQLSDTQFRITSASATDTSTVNWYISPLGRAIYVTP